MSVISRRRLSLLAGLALVALILLLVSCTPTEAPQTTISPKSEVADWIQSLYKLLFWMAVVVFVVVETLLVIAVFRFRRREGDSIPRQVHGSLPLELGWTIVPAILLIVVAVPTWIIIFRTEKEPEAALQVEVIGHQWWWEFRYPEFDIVTANELHIPEGVTVQFRLQSADVIHSFWVPQLAGKKDALPAHGSSPNTLFLTPREAGLYPGQCAEFCGVAHANMLFRVFVDKQEDFDRWVQAQQAPPAQPTGLAALGRQVFTSAPCQGCHTIEGVSTGTIGPNLTHVGSRTTIAAGILENTPENLARWIRDPQAVKPGNKMPKVDLSEQQLTALVAYLESLK